MIKIDILNKLYKLEDREEVIKHKKMKPKIDHSYLVNEKKEVLYEYYECDVCGKEIKVETDWSKQTGGVVVLSRVITKKGDLKLALHNECLQKVLEEFDKK